VYHPSLEVKKKKKRQTGIITVHFHTALSHSGIHHESGKE
jgi:hypothetical protein